MISFFFYNKLTNIELIKKINNNFKIDDGYILIQNYNSENNLLEIDDKLTNNKLLYGKIVDFNMNLYDIIKKINEIEECKLENRIKYTLKTIWVNKTFSENYETYIIF
jgi:hypothetical protein